MAMCAAETSTKRARQKLCIAMSCDFFHPNVGGIESHIYALSQCLIRRGHRVIVITHSYGPKHEQRQGVRYMARGLKVYYIPMMPFYKQSVFITVLGTLPIIREILIREQVDIVHGHCIFSSLACETLIHAQSMSLPTIFTEHSLFGFADLSSIIMNKVMEGVLSNVDEVICVSHTAKENLTLRAQFHPNRIYVIPNAVDALSFTPDFSARDPNYITIIVISRLVYRKGIDLLVSIIPSLCSRFPELRFIIGGDGPKRLELEEVRERHQLHSRIKLLGSLEPHKVRSVLVQGDIFLNTSLTESFCIAIIEAVSCGLLVVSTSVGGVPEVLPQDFIHLVPAKSSDLLAATSEVIEEVRTRRSASNSPLSELSIDNHKQIEIGESTPNGGIEDTRLISSESSHQDHPEPLLIHGQRMHNFIKNIYTWPQVARRTEQVYYDALDRPRLTHHERMKRYYQLGSITGKLVLWATVLHWLLFHILCWLRPDKVIGKAVIHQFPIEDDSKTSQCKIISDIKPTMTSTMKIASTTTRENREKQFEH